MMSDRPPTSQRCNPDERDRQATQQSQAKYRLCVDGMGESPCTCSTQGAPSSSVVSVSAADTRRAESARTETTMRREMAS